MLRSTIAKRLGNLKVNKTSFAYQLVRDLAMNTNKTYKVYGDIIRPCHTSGTGRYTRNMDYTDDVIRLLKSLHVMFEIGNDAPRGGLTGNYIKVKYLK
jgi:hypothetical protein